MEAVMKYAFADKLVMLAELAIKPDKLEEFLDYTVENLKISRSYPGNIEFDILIDQAQSDRVIFRSEEHTSELQSLLRISYAVFCLTKKNTITNNTNTQPSIA